MREIYPQVYVNQIPLPHFPLQYVNSYLLVSDRRNVMIDTGFNTPEGRDSIFKSIDRLGVALHKTDVVLTHMHPDHVGMALCLQQQGATIYIGRVDGYLLSSVYAKTSKVFLTRFYEDNLREKNAVAQSGLEGGENSTDGVAFHYLQENDVFTVGEYRLKVIDLPGHTPGHIGLYEASHSLLFSGDHILDPISPSIVFWDFEQDMLACYLRSLKKVSRFDIKHLLVAHGDKILNYRRRIDDLIYFAEQRLDEVKHIISVEGQTPLDIAAAVHWNVPGGWPKFTIGQRLAALGETLAFLEHLTHDGFIVRFCLNGKWHYRLKQKGII